MQFQVKSFLLLKSEMSWCDGKGGVLVDEIGLTIEKIGNNGTIHVVK